MTARDPVALCLEGRISPEVAVARMLLAGADPAAIARQVQTARKPGARWAELARVAGGETLGLLRRMIDGCAVDHSGAATPAQIAALFDQAVAASPEASVAMFSLGRAATLAAATEELLAWLDRHQMLAPDKDVLDLGCGIGRVAAALAGRVRSVLGLDVSAGMVRQAQARCAGMANLRFEVTAGEGLAGVPDVAFDLVLAVDSFPYVVQAGLGARHVADAGRVLRAGGALVILNFSYRGDDAADRTDAGAWARQYGFQLLQCGVPGFRLWDGLAYVLVKRGNPIQR